MDDLQRRRCETCEQEITGLARLARHGQKIAVLERFDGKPPHLPAGATLVVNLPTGAGKTLAMLAAAETAPPGTTSIIVVPTVAEAPKRKRK